MAGNLWEWVLELGRWRNKETGRFMSGWSVTSRSGEITALTGGGEMRAWQKNQEARSPQQVATVKLTSCPALAACKHAENRATQGNFNR